MAIDWRARVERLRGIVRRLRKKLKGGEAPPQAEHEVEAFPTIVSDSPSADPEWTNASNLFLDDGNFATVTLAGDSVATHFEGFGFSAILPGDAVISQVEIVFEAWHDGTVDDAVARPQVSPRCYGTPSPGSWEGPTGVSSSPTEHTADVTDHPSINPAAWGSDIWTNDLLADENFKVGCRSRNIGELPGQHFWDYVYVRVTYTGSPPGAPQQVRHTINAATVGDGAGKVTGPGIDTSTGDSSETVPAGTNMELTVTPDPGSVFEQWEGHASGTENPVVVVVDGPKTVDARIVGTPAGDPVEGHWGLVVKEDRVTNPSHIEVWRSQSTPWYSGQHVSESGDPDEDPYLQRIAESGLWVPHGQSIPSAHFRRHIAPVCPPQSIYDSHVRAWPASNAPQRTQLQRWSSQDAWWIGRTGERVWITWGFRVMEDPPITKPIGGGSPGYYQLVQWKVRASGYSEVDSVTVGANGIQFEFSAHPGNVEARDTVVCEHGLWHRCAVEMLLHDDPGIGYYTPWFKGFGEDEWRQVGPKRTQGTLVANGYRNMGIGPYGQIIATTNNQLYYCDYRDIQIIGYV